MDKQEIINAARGAEWRSLSRADKERTVIMAMNGARLMKDMSRMPADQEQFCRDELVPYIDRNAPYLTDEEIALALKMGTRKELGNTDNYVTIANAELWIGMYKTNPERAETLHLERAECADSDQESVPEKNIKALDDSIHRAYDWYRSSGGYILNDTREEGGIRLPALAAMTYDWHRSINHIPEPTPAELEQAEEYAQFMAERHSIIKVLSNDIESRKDDLRKTALLALYFQSMSGIVFTY